MNEFMTSILVTKDICEVINDNFPEHINNTTTTHYLFLHIHKWKHIHPFHR